jgi:hypothetical protein
MKVTITMRELTRKTGASSGDLTNWSMRGLIELPPSRQGSERVFGAGDREILLRVAFMKVLVNSGFSVGEASIVAKGWAEKALTGDLPPFIAFNPRRPEDRRLEYTKPISVAAFFETDAFSDDVGGDHLDGAKGMTPILPASAIVIINRGEIVSRIDAALGGAEAGETAGRPQSSEVR